MLSSVFAILQANSPGRPSSRYQNTGATTPSLKFSARLSIAARATPAASRRIGSRPTICLPASLERMGDCGDMLEKASLCDQDRDQEGLECGADQAAAAQPRERPSHGGGGADQRDQDEDAALAARRLAALLAIELPVAEGDRAAGQDDRMRNSAEQRRHVAKDGVEREAGDQDQKRAGEAGRDHAAATLGPDRLRVNRRGARQ